jgi:chromosome segregation ATPase
MAGGITEQDVFAAAEALQAEGVKPTQTTVRERLGGGSFATIGPALKRWREAQWEQHELAEVELPPELDEALQQLGGRVWQAAIAAAESRLAAERAALAEAREELEAEAAEQRAAVQQLEAEAEQYQRQIAELDQRLAQEQVVSDKANQLVAGLTTELSAAQAATEAEVGKVEAVYQERVAGLEARLQDALHTVERLTEREG